jgi:hypothetical protein
VARFGRPLADGIGLHEVETLREHKAWEAMRIPEWIVQVERFADGYRAQLVRAVPRKVFPRG